MTAIGVVIPTTFNRPGYLVDSIESVRAAGDAFILLCGPNNHRKRLYESLVDDFSPELHQAKLGAIINHALKQLPENCEYITWLGDDDLLTPGSLERSMKILEENGDVVLVYGSCDYIDQDGKKIGQNPSGPWAEGLMRFGPFLVPQPGSLWRRDAFEAIGGISKGFSLAFDHDLFLRLRTRGRFQHIKTTQAAFRWHTGSLSVGKRWISVMEASKARRKHYLLALAPIWLIWEPLVMLATKFAGDFVNFRTKSPPIK